MLRSGNTLVRGMSSEAHSAYKNRTLVCQDDSREADWWSVMQAGLSGVNVST